MKAYLVQVILRFVIPKKENRNKLINRVKGKIMKVKIIIGT